MFANPNDFRKVSNQPPAYFAEIVVFQGGRFVVENAPVRPAAGQPAATLAEQLDRIRAVIDSIDPQHVPTLPAAQEACDR